MSFDKTTERDSNYRHLEKMSTATILQSINNEDKTVPQAVGQVLPQIEKLVNSITDKMLGGGRLFYIGAGTSGRLGIVDASECPPTFGVNHGLVVGMMAGGDSAIRKAVEFAEDDEAQGWKDLQDHLITTNDSVIGIAASGTTPYVIGAIKKAREFGCITGCITCNAGSPLAHAAEQPIECIVGPEFVTGSTRMKAGTAQKLILNMISTAIMIKLGRVEDNKMVDMHLSNDKLVERGINMVMKATNCNFETAQQNLLKEGSVRKATNAISAYKNKI